MKTARGGSRTKERQGTQVHWQLALAYAKYLSPEIHLQVNINQLHVAAGKKRNQSPRDWLKQDNVKELIDALCKKEHVTQDHIINKSKTRADFDSGIGSY